MVQYWLPVVYNDIVIILDTVGFHLCALIQQLSDILPNDLGVRKLTELARGLFKHFDGRMGCVEIVGKSTCVERVYFRIKQSRSLQWTDRSIKVSMHVMFIEIVC